MSDLLKNCMLCPRHCGVNREKGEVGYCKAGAKIKIAKAYLHQWEEPPITGKNGSGTIFFSNCNLRCLFCQNYFIGEEGNGVEISTEKFSEVCLDLQKDGATNINLVTPTHYVPLIIEGIKLARKKGLIIPIVYNSSGYEDVDTLRLLADTVDIYLPDFKYYDNNLAMKYSKCPNYFECAKAALAEMVRQKPKCIFNEEGNMVSGVIVRHLLLPGAMNDSKKILDYLYHEYGDRIYFSIMNQYTLVRKCKYQELNEKVSDSAYDEVIDYAWNMGIRQAFVQDGKTQDASFIPKWDFKV